ncbi:hypothetical protein ACSSS7_004657 [Eimeria intestinalis]
MLWKETPEYEPEIPLELNPICFIMATVSILGGTSGARRDPEEEEGTDQAPEPTGGSPTPLSPGGTGDGDSEEDLRPLPFAQPSVPAASSVPSRSARTAATRPPPPPLPSSKGGQAADNSAELIFGWDMMSLRSWWWAVTPA